MTNEVRFKFWMSANKTWPRDTFAHVFLGRAIDEIGKSMFGNDWAGALDVIQDLEPTFPRRAGARTPGEKLRAHRLLANYRPELGRQRLALNAHRVDDLSAEEWLAAEEIIAKHNRERLPGIHSLFCRTNS
jgi:hypothetical protein